MSWSVEWWFVGWLVEAGRRADCCQQHQLVVVLLEIQPLAGKQVLAVEKLWTKA